MAYPTPAVTVTTANTFIPEIWSDEIVAAYKKNLVLANIVMKMNFKGKKGDTIHMPAPTRGSASAKAASTAVTLIADTETEVQVLINKHYEYSRFIEDIVEAQALNSLRFVVEAQSDSQSFVAHGVPTLVAIVVPVGLVVTIQVFERDRAPPYVVRSLFLHLDHPARREPRPRTHWIEEEFEVTHGRLPIASRFRCGR